MTEEKVQTAMGTDTRTDDELKGIKRTSRRDFLRATVGAGAVLTGVSATSGAAIAQEGSLPALQRNGTEIVTAGGKTVDLHGVNIADPKRVDVTASVRGKTATQAIDLATDTSQGWYSDVVRLPVQPVDIGEHQAGSGPEPPAFDESQLQSYMENHLDAAVEACAANGAYAIIDYHRHRDIPWGSTTNGEFSPNQALSNEVMMFWNNVAPRYGDKDHVIFEVYNEPQGYPNWGVSGQELVDYWRNWKSTAQPWVNTIRQHSDNLVLIGSPRWSQLTYGAVIEEFDGANLAYTIHLYPGHTPTMSADYDDFLTPPGGDDAPYPTDTAAFEVAPVFMTEWGFDYDAPAGAGGAVNQDTADQYGWAEYDPNYGQHVTNWLATRPVHSTAWCFDPLWEPAMFSRGFDVPDEENWSPYTGGSIPEYVTDLPAKWNLETDNGYMGDTVKNFLQGDFANGRAIEDVNGDGRTTTTDVQALFNGLDSDRMQNNPTAFDFNGDSSVTVSDVVSLFRQIV